MAAMLHGGATLEEIGVAAGITRERVRQRLKRIGVVPSRRLDVPGLLNTIRGSRVGTLGAAAREIGSDATAVRKALEALGMLDAVERLFRLRRRAERNAVSGEFLASLVRYAKVLGHTPRAEDIVRGDRPAYVPSLGAIQKRFGSLSAAMKAAGLPANQRGRRTPGSS